jgi:hypothetical protein
MSELLAGIIVVGAMLAPYLVVAALTAAFPRLRQGIGQIPRTDEVVAQFFDRTMPGSTRRPADIRMWTEDDPSWSSSGSVGERR